MAVLAGTPDTVTVLRRMSPVSVMTLLACAPDWVTDAVAILATTRLRRLLDLDPPTLLVVTTTTGRCFGATRSFAICLLTDWRLTVLFDMPSVKTVCSRRETRV